MNKWTLLLILIGLAAAGMLNRDKITAYLNHQKITQGADATPDASATPNPAMASKDQARQRYPQLGIANSPFNQHFVQLYNAAKATDPNLLAQADWPMQLADRTAQDLNMVATATPPPTEMSTSSPNQRPPGYVGSTVPPSVQLPGLKGSALDQRPPSHHR